MNVKKAFARVIQLRKTMESINSIISIENEKYLFSTHSDCMHVKFSNGDFLNVDWSEIYFNKNGEEIFIENNCDFSDKQLAEIRLLVTSFINRLGAE